MPALPEPPPELLLLLLLEVLAPAALAALCALRAFLAACIARGRTGVDREDMREAPEAGNTQGKGVHSAGFGCPSPVLTLRAALEPGSDAARAAAWAVRASARCWAVRPSVGCSEPSEPCWAAAAAWAAASRAALRSARRAARSACVAGGGREHRLSWRSVLRCNA